MRLVMAIGVWLGLGLGCVVGQTIPYHEATPSLKRARGPLVVGLAVEDERMEIVTRKKTASFVGLLRHDYGIPFDVRTRSGRPLEADLTLALTLGLAESGYHVVQVVVTPDQSSADIVRDVANAGGAHALIVRVNEWKSDTYQRTTLSYDLSVRVLSVPGGEVLGESFVTGQDVIPPGGWTTAGHIANVLPKALRAKLEEMLDGPAIRRALASAAPAGPPIAGSMPR
jgi:hypothetical protein